MKAKAADKLREVPLETSIGGNMPANGKIRKSVILYINIEKKGSLDAPKRSNKILRTINSSIKAMVVLINVVKPLIVLSRLILLKLYHIQNMSRI